MDWHIPEQGFGKFKLYYLNECPYKYADLGTEIASPIVDGLGNITEFIGRGHIDSIKSVSDFEGLSEITVEVVYTYVL